ncbi:gluconokinase [Corallococcus macrosporus]|uniref:Gluconokinase n=1 Tax=Myxococcus fulvus (strain ATCC BAA-855 / HW-1) TaxID=483219 RepID=F8CR27_MYXFH|nr:gluconokinase [Corallococcus macrosporus]AEI63071.1 thermosensitive gluconokinase [Corallococcus macrosporus]
MVVIVMGVSGAGKTTVGRTLAAELGWRFVDADDLHPRSNVMKMAAGAALTDEDRAPWLRKLRDEVAQALSRGEDVVMAFSGLKQAYRTLLEALDPAHVKWVFLHAPHEVLARRISQRQGHFMPATLLESQLATMEVPERALSVDVTPPPAEIVKRIRDGLGV